MGSKERLNPTSKNIRHVGLWGTAIGGGISSIWIVDETEDQDTEGGIIASFVGAIISVLVSCGILIYRYCRRDDDAYAAQEGDFLCEEEDEGNPWNARLKAGVVLGEGVGRTLFSIIPIPWSEKLLLLLGSAIGGIIGGITALFCVTWEPSQKKPITPNPSSERIRSGAMFGSYFGIAAGACFIFLPGLFEISTVILFGAGFGALLGGIAAYLMDDEAKTAEKSENNPWSKRIRAGMQWFACIGMLLGVLFPGLGIGLSATLSIIVAGAAFSVVGAVISYAAEYLIKALDDKKDEKVDNPWGPRCRAGVAWGTSLGVLISCLVCSLDIYGASFGGAIGGLVGGFIGIVIEPLYLRLMQWWKPGLDHAEHSFNPWSERCRTWTLVGAAVGAFIAYLICPPFVFLGGGIGGVAGGIVGGLGSFVVDYIQRHFWPPPSELEDNSTVGLDTINTIPSSSFPSESTPADLAILQLNLKEGTSSEEPSGDSEVKHGCGCF